MHISTDNCFKCEVFFIPPTISEDEVYEKIAAVLGCTLPILDVECLGNDYVAPCKKDVEYLNERWNCHELDEKCQDFDKIEAEERPMFFFFALGKILDSFGL